MIFVFDFLVQLVLFFLLIRFEKFIYLCLESKYEFHVEFDWKVYKSNTNKKS